MDMTVRKKYIAGIGAVAVAVTYGLTRWRGNFDDSDDQAPVTEYQTPADN
jgi:hypothetical protein